MENHEKIGLYEIKELLRQELARIISLQSKGKVIYPPSTVTPFSIEELADAFAEINFHPFANSAIRDYFQNLLGTPDTPFTDLDPRHIASTFPNGSKICLITLPFRQSGLPLDPEDQNNPAQLLHLLRIGEDGQTFDFSSRPAYYFPFFPPEIQSQCIFEVPAYENMRMPSPAEIAELRNAFFQALSNLEKLFSLPSSL